MNQSNESVNKHINRIISFDVGIKNMAYCIFSVNQTAETKKQRPFEIIDWNVLNLMEREPTEEIESNKCQVLSSIKKKPTKKSKEEVSQQKPCTKEAKYKLNSVKVDESVGNANESVGKSSEYFCEKHAKESTTYILPTGRFSSSQLKKMDIEKLNELSMKYTLEIAKTKKSAIENLESYFAKNTLQSLKKKTKSANDLNLITLGQHMMHALDANPHIVGITHVIIENQISPIANRMKTVQGMLAQYFIMRVPGCQIDFISSANKLKAFIPKKGEAENSVRDTDSKLCQYKQHKSDGVYYTSQLLQQNAFISCWQEHVNSSKKKDDLADAFLQGIWYLTNRKIIITAENLKINSISIS